MSVLAHALQRRTAWSGVLPSVRGAPDAAQLAHAPLLT